MSAFNQLCVAPNGADTNNAVGVPTGSIHLWGTATAPTGWLICDGTAYSTFAYPELFSVIGTTWGVGYGTTVSINNSVGSVSPATQNTITFTVGSVPAALQIPGARFIMSARGNNYDVLIWTVFSYSGASPSVIVATATQNGTPVIFNTTPVTAVGTVTPIVENTFAVPNTSQKVVRGIYPVTYEIASTGGADTVTISADNLPPHRHGITSLALTGPTGTGGGSIGVSAGQVYTAVDQTYTNASTPTAVTNSAISIRDSYISIPYIIKT